jgi:hypothetical protein
MQVLFSPRHGAFYWHPGLLLAFAGLLIGTRLPRLRLICLAMFVAELWVIASWSIWWAGASFGHRLFISALPALAVGAASLISKWPLAQRITPAIVTALVLWNFGYVVQYGSGMISRQGSVSLRELAHNNFVKVPQLLLGKNPDPGVKK